ncbi:AI-2E family transporter [Candidatus Parcubacteria bacterium]|nr:MAG: AI-2E family transporter [Candidatus Parcubacteria bacterium]
MATSYRKPQIYFFLGLFFVAALLNVYLLFPYLSAIILGATFAVIFYPLYQKFLFLARGSKSVAALVTTFLVLALVLTPLIYFSIVIFQQASGLYFSLTAKGEPLMLSANPRLATFLKKVLLIDADKIESLSLNVSQYLTQALNVVVQNFGAFFSSIAKVLFTLFISLFTLYYFLKDGDRFRKAVVELSPLSDRHDAQILGKLHLVVNSVIRGTLTVAVVQGVLAGIGFFIFGVPNAAVWGMVGIIAALIPAVGSALVTVPGVIYLFAIGNVVQAVGLLAWAMFVVGLIDNFLRPKIIERKIHIHPLFILLSVLGGLAVFGPFGFLLGPLLLSFFFALLDIYREEFKEYVTKV